MLTDCPLPQMEGNVTYNGYSIDEIVHHKTSGYVSPYDVHIGETTARETLVKELALDMVCNYL